MHKKSRLILPPAMLAACVFIGSCFVSCRAQPRQEIMEAEQPIVIGFSQVETESPWRTAQLNSFRYAISPGEMRLVYHEPEEYTTAWQVQDVYQLIRKEKVDYLVVAPRETAPLQPALQEAMQAGIPVFLIEHMAREISREDYTTLISTDYRREGELCAQLLAQRFDGQECNIVEIYGAPSSPVAQARARGFREEVQKHPNMRIIGVEYGNFDRIAAQKAMENALIRTAATRQRIDAVFAHSDEDGLGALQALKVAGKRPGVEIEIVSVNGVQDVCKAIIAGEYLATVESSPKWGQVVVMLVRMMERGSKPFPSVFIPNRIIDAQNAQELFPLAY